MPACRQLDETIGQLLALVSQKAPYDLLSEQIERLHSHIQALFPGTNHWEYSTTARNPESEDWSIAVTAVRTSGNRATAALRSRGETHDQDERKWTVKPETRVRFPSPAPLIIKGF